jgi:hypothetical protein
MAVPEDAQANSKDLSGGDNKRREVLLELLDHTIDKHLSNCTESSHQ